MNWKKQVIIYIVVFLVLSIFVVGGLLATINESGSNGILDTVISGDGSFSSNLLKNIINPFHSLSVLFAKDNTKALQQYKSAEMVLFFVYVGSIIYFKTKTKSHAFQNVEHGSSDWAKGGEEYNKAQDGREILNRKDGFILSRNHFLGTDLKKVGINKNVLVIGGSGTGKSACFVKPNILQQLGSYVITDPKGELYRETSGFLKAQGYEVKVLNLVDPEKSNAYNPMAHIKDSTDVDIIAHTIVSGGEDGGKASDPFWDNTAKMLLKAAMYYLMSMRPIEEQNLSSALAIVKAGGSDEQMMNSLFEELPMDNPGRREYESIRVGADTTKKSIAISVVSKLGHFDSPSIKKITGSNDINFEDLGNKKMALFVISPDSHSSYNYILTIFYAQLLQRLYAQADRNGGSLNNQVYLLLDEFANIGKIPDFNQKLSTSRSRGISMSIIVQSLDQLIDLYKDLHENIISNCDTQIFLGSQSIKTCEYVSKSLGQKTLTFESKSRSESNTKDGKDSYSYSTQRQGRDLMTIDELKRLGSDEEIILVRGVKPIKAKKAWYFKYHPLKDAIKQYEIRDINDMPSPIKPPMDCFDVSEYMTNRNSRILEEKEKIKKESDDNKQIEPENIAEEIDLQKELEKKFDELFGPTSEDKI